MKHLLVVDPEPVVREFLHEKLTAPNVVVDTAPTGTRALERMGEKRYDLLLVALEMPHPNAGDLIRALREQRPNAPAIVTSKTAYVDDLARGRAFELGASAVVEKPIVLTSLFEAIETTLDFKIDGNERRLYPRIPLSLDLFMEGGKRESSRVSIRSNTIDISLGGCCFEREAPDPPPPYKTGGIDPAHPFYKYFSKNPAAQTVRVTLSLARSRLHGPALLWVPETLMIEGHLAHIILDKATRREYIGVRFTNFAESERQKLKAYLRALAEEMKA